MNLSQLVKKKIYNFRAFTLAETLVAVLIMLMVSSIVAAGIPAAKSAYEKVFIAANSELLMSTTISTLRNEFVGSKDIEVKDNTTITYYSNLTGIKSGISVDGKKIILKRHVGSDLSKDDGRVVQLISKPTVTKDLDVYYEKVESETGYVVFSNLVVEHNGKTITKRPKVSIRTI